MNHFKDEIHHFLHEIHHFLTWNSSLQCKLFQCKCIILQGKKRFVLFRLEIASYWEETLRIVSTRKRKLTVDRGVRVGSSDDDLELQIWKPKKKTPDLTKRSVSVSQNIHLRFFPENPSPFFAENLCLFRSIYRITWERTFSASSASAQTTAKFIIFYAKFLVFDTQSLGCDTQCDTQFIIFTHWRGIRCARRTYNNSSFSSENQRKIVMLST